MDVILRRVGGIVGGPLHHRKRAALERDQVEEPATMLERDAMLVWIKLFVRSRSSNTRSSTCIGRSEGPMSKHDASGTVSRMR